VICVCTKLSEKNVVIVIRVVRVIRAVRDPADHVYWTVLLIECYRNYIRQYDRVIIFSISVPHGSLKFERASETVCDARPQMKENARKLRAELQQQNETQLAVRSAMQEKQWKTFGVEIGNKQNILKKLQEEMDKTRGNFNELKDKLRQLHVSTLQVLYKGLCSYLQLCVTGYAIGLVS